MAILKGVLEWARVGWVGGRVAILGASGAPGGGLGVPTRHSHSLNCSHPKLELPRLPNNNLNCILIRPFHILPSLILSFLGTSYTLPHLFKL